MTTEIIKQNFDSPKNGLFVERERERERLLLLPAQFQTQGIQP